MQQASITTEHAGLNPGKITLYGIETGDYLADFDATATATVPLDVASATVATPGYAAATEEDEALIAGYVEEVRLSPEAKYNAGPPVFLTILDLATTKITAGDNLPVEFNRDGVAQCAQKTAETFLESYPDAKIVFVTPVEEPVTETPKIETPVPPVPPAPPSTPVVDEDSKEKAEQEQNQDQQQEGEQSSVDETVDPSADVVTDADPAAAGTAAKGRGKAAAAKADPAATGTTA